MTYDYILNWIDLLWIPAAYLLVRKGQRVGAIIFTLVCVFALRMQVELMDQIGFHHGFFKFVDLPVLYRGFMTYAVFIAVFLFISRISREKDAYIFIAAGITVFMAAFAVSTFIMLL